uniref:Uncharacterized protein n=1 Tax=Anopheles atroparvus TaxID=41427 RepID=A0A182J239_ANOAO
MITACQLDLHTGLHCIRSYTRRCMNIHQRDHFNKLYHGTNEVIHELCEEGPYQEGTHAPCMRRVKKDYEICATRYQSTMSKIGQAAPTTTTTTTTTASTAFHQFHAGTTMATHPVAALSSGQYHADHDVSQHHHHRRQEQHKQHEHPGRGAHRNNTKSVEEAEEEHLKTVCCAFQKYMQCSEFTVRHACGDETALFTRKFLDKMSNTLMRMHCVDYTPESGKCRDYFTSSATRTGFRRWSSSAHYQLLAVVTLAVLFLQPRAFI